MSLRSSIAELFPLPFLGVVVLLVILIFLTPNLVSNGTPAAGSLPTEAELIVDHVPTSNLTHLYVRSIGTVRFVSISVALDANLTWPVLHPSQVQFPNATVWNHSLESAVTTSANPFAVNVTAIYVDASGTAVEYVGTYAFHLAGGTLVAISLAPGATAIPPTPVSALPLFLLLSSQAPGGPP